MTSETIYSTIRRNKAEQYILISLVAFAATVIVTRAFLELTGYPQIGNSVLHIAHALWGGLLLILAAYLPLAYANRWALEASAVLSGIGIGLFIDEVGKFITQANDYFFPPALPLIYSFVLLNTLVYIYFRRSNKEDSRIAMYHALEGLQDVLDGNLDTRKMSKIEAQLDIGRQSNRTEIVSLADALSIYLEKETRHLAPEKPDLRRRFALWTDEAGLRFGRRKLRAVISFALIGWGILVIGYIITILQGGTNLDPQVLQWRNPLIGVQVIVGILITIGAFFWIIQKEELGLKLGVSGFLLSLVALQLLYFYISQFSAITSTLMQLAILQLLFAYHRWYLKANI